jgi:hypothetical protein
MKQPQQILRVKVQLRDVRPAIWRRIEVPASYAFWDLHVAIQDAMGWFDSHLHVFRVDNPQTGELDEIGIPDPDGFEDDPIVLEGWEIPVARYLQKSGDRAEYEYDLGDGWEHEVLLETATSRQPKTKYPRCLAGARACPPEDCGGPSGYAELLKTIADPSHPERENLQAWLGEPFEPEAFDCREVHFDNPKKRWKIAFADG